MKYYIIRILEKLRLLQYFNFNISTNINGKKMVIPVLNGIGQQHLSNHERWFDGFLQKLLSKVDGGFVDVGVNIGQTLLKVASINREMPYVGFEPNPFAFCYAYRLIEVNQLKYHQLYYVGLYTEEKMVTLHMDNYLSSGASVLANFREDMSRYKRLMNVPVFRADAVFNTISFKAGCLKIDVEGAELEVLKGAKTFLENNKPVIVLEILPVYSLEKENGRFRKTREEELITFLHGLNYTMYRINEQTITLTQMSEIPVHGNMSLTNYIFIPNEQTATFTTLFQ
jgi:FkbM family methyltransferase